MTRGQLIGAGRTAEVFAWGDDRALKLFYDGFSQEAIEDEAKKTRLARAAGLPVPAVDGVIDLDGRRGIVYERVEGRSMLATIRARPVKLFALVARLADLHTLIHSRRSADLPVLRGRLAWSIEHAPPLPADLKDAALRALDCLPDGETICHCDFHPDNVLLTPRGPVIIDWDNSARGDPLADVARTRLLIRAGIYFARSAAERRLFRATLPAARALYLRRYRRLRPLARPALAAWDLPVMAARLMEGISAEQPALLDLIRAAAAA